MLFKKLVQLVHVNLVKTKCFQRNTVGFIPLDSVSHSLLFHLEVLKKLFLFQMRVMSEIAGVQRRQLGSFTSGMQIE